MHEEDNILVLHNCSYEELPLVRVQSACYTAEIFRSLDCDCHAQLSVSQQKISNGGLHCLYYFQFYIYKFRLIRVA